MFLLSGYRRNMSVTQRLLLFRGGTCIDPTVATVVADTIQVTLLMTVVLYTLWMLVTFTLFTERL
jgi:hypothetical protein